MMTPATAHAPALRLVNESALPEAQPLTRGHRAARRVRSENRLAVGIQTGIEPFDARWVLAVRTSQLLDGGRAAILRPDHRRKLVSMAVGLGLRPFDANLVIAIVQDSARSGLPVLGRMTEDRLVLVPAAREAAASSTRDQAIRLLAVAAGIGMAMLGGVLMWMRGG
ncbi:MAG: hypothetical protein WD749_13310 [Phycisphaerales bacterium]